MIEAIASGKKAETSQNILSVYTMLSMHLKKTAAYIAQKSTVELLGLGIQTDVDFYYSNSVRIDDPQALGTIMADNLDKLFKDPNTGRRRRRIVPIAARTHDP